MRKGSFLMATLFAGLPVFTATARAEQPAAPKNVIELAHFSPALDAKSEAREEIRRIKANISQANKDISSLENRLLAGEIAIALNEVAIVEAKKKENNEGAVLALEIALAVLKSKKNDLIKEKKDLEQYRRECQTSLAEWEAYLRKLGG